LETCIEKNDHHRGVTEHSEIRVLGQRDRERERRRKTKRKGVVALEALLGLGSSVGVGGAARGATTILIEKT